MKKNKGFTLVELLAVIVILAVIALIATPTVLKMIEDARQGAAESSMLSYKDQIEKQIVTSSMNASSAVNYDQTYNISGTTLSTGGENPVTLDLDITGDKPTTADNTTVVVSNGSVELAQLKFGAYYVTYYYNAGSKDVVYCSNKTSFAKNTNEAENAADMVYCPSK